MAGCFPLGKFHVEQSGFFGGQVDAAEGKEPLRGIRDVRRDGENGRGDGGRGTFEGKQHGGSSFLFPIIQRTAFSAYHPGGFSVYPGRRLLT